MRKEFGTYLFKGMNSATAPHLLEDAQLAYAAGVDFDTVRGSLQMSLGPDTHISLSGTAAHGGGVFENDGEIIYKLDQNMQRNGDTFTPYASGNDNDVYFLPMGDRMYMADGSGNKVHDGTSWRDHGALEPSAQEPEDTQLSLAAADNMASIITGISKTDPVVVSCSTTPGLITGDGIYFGAVAGVGMDELWGRSFRVTLIPGNKLELDNEDGTDHTAWTSSDQVYRNAVGRESGTYRYAASYKISLASGDVLESSLIPITRGSARDISFNEGPLEPTNPTVRLSLKAPEISVADLAGYTHPAEVAQGNGFDIGINITPTIRFWRTKDGGSTYYLLRELLDYTEVYDNGSAGAYDDLPDALLGAAWLDDEDGHDQPPASTIMAHAGERIYCNDESAPRRLWFSGTWQPDYFPPLNYIDLPADITALGTYGDSVLIYSNSRLWRYANLDGIGTLEEVDTPEGTPYPRSVALTPYGAVHAGERGIYLYRGTTPKRISGPIQDLFLQEPGPWQCVFVDNKLHCYGGDLAFGTAAFIDEDVQWSLEVTDKDWLFGRRGDASPYTMDETGIDLAYSVSDNIFVVDSKQWRLPGPSRVEYVWIDCKTDSYGIVVTLVHDDGTEVLATNETNTQRGIMRFSAPIEGLKQGYQLRVGGWIDAIYGMGMVLYG